MLELVSEFIRTPFLSDAKTPTKFDNKRSVRDPLRNSVGILL